MHARLQSAAHDQLGFMRELVKTYALSESPSGDAAALAACAELIAASHEEAGGLTVKDGEHLVTVWQAASDAGLAAPGHVLVLGHYDTVWPIGRLATMPYSDDGVTIAGPGTYDMKGGLVILETAIRILAELGIPLRHEVRAVVVADEEIGSPSGREVVERHAQGALAVFGLEPPHPHGVLKTGRRGSTRVRINVRGREAHAALDRSMGISAIDELLDQLLFVRKTLPSDGSVLANIGRIHGGTRANVIAGEASAEIGFRFTNLDVERSVLGAIQGITPIRDGAEVDVAILSNRPAWQEPDENPLLDSIVATGEQLGLRIGGRPAAGAGDTNFTGALGIPSLDGFGPVGRGAHSKDEQFQVASMPERTALLAAVLVGALPPIDGPPAARADVPAEGGT